MIRQSGSQTLRVPETRTFFFSADFCLQVLGVNIDKVLFLAFALPAAEAAAAQTAAACEDAAAHHKSLNIVVFWGGRRRIFKQFKVNFVTCRVSELFKPLDFLPYLEPALGHEEVIFDPLFPKLLRSVEAHGSIFVVNVSFVLVTEDGVGIVDLFKLFSSFRIVRILVRVMPQSQFSGDKQV